MPECQLVNRAVGQFPRIDFQVSSPRLSRPACFLFFPTVNFVVNDHILAIADMSR
jgi:hypothetical protein